MRIGTKRHDILLAIALVGSALGAACGGAPAPATSPTQTATASDGGSLSPTTTAPGASDAPSASGAAPGAAAPSGPTASVDIGPSKMIADVKAIGIDLEKPGDLSKIEMSKKKKLMPLFVKALGMSGCTGCHVENDYKAPTHNKEMASAMWTHFVRDLRAKGGGALFCDSCHQGKQKLLARTDKKVLSAFMHENYEEKLQRTSKKEHGCETCHSDPFEGKVFAKLWRFGPT